MNPKTACCVMDGSPFADRSHQRLDRVFRCEVHLPALRETLVWCCSLEEIRSYLRRDLDVLIIGAL